MWRCVSGSSRPRSAQAYVTRADVQASEGKGKGRERLSGSQQTSEELRQFFWGRDIRDFTDEFPRISFDAPPQLNDRAIPFLSQLVLQLSNSKCIWSWMTLARPLARVIQLQMSFKFTLEHVLLQRRPLGIILEVGSPASPRRVT